MNNDKWFVMVAGQVKGPFRQIELESMLGQWSNAMIWGKGQHEWMAPPRWKTFITESQQRQDIDHQRADRLWRVLIQEDQVGPMNYEAMIKLLASRQDLQEVRIWTEGYGEWKEVYQIHKIMDDLGVSRRAHPRVPILGALACDGASGTFTARLLSLSEGGLGATEGKNIKMGDRLKVVVKAQNLQAPIAATVEVVFLGRDGYFGMKFMGLQSEARTMISEYIKRFTSPSA
jgi:hypothetical protein